MSEPTRYDFDEYGRWDELSHGDYILHFDYEKEVSRLKAEVEAYRSASDEVAAAFLALPAPHNQVARVCEGIESLKAEVERLTEIIRREVDGGVDLREEAQRTVDENHKLRAEVERLRKAGDMLAFALAHGDRMEYGCVSDPIEEYLDRKEIKEWNDAWEGKQS